ncbi:MAG: hypothetical protein ACR2QZ_07370 [Woeseiaceae bacterium]
MSSNRYFAELQPDTTLRMLIMVSGIGLGFVGEILIVALPFHAAALIVGGGAWLAFAVREQAKLLSAFRRYGRLRIGVGGSLMRLDSEGCWREGRLLPGSLVLSRLAWIRYEINGDIRSAELLRGDCLESHDWRRLQVIWRHIGAAG